MRCESLSELWNGTWPEAVRAVNVHQLRCSQSAVERALCKVVSTDPPYYDNIIGYADLSDFFFFYVWLRPFPVKPVFPDLFATLSVPKAEELAGIRHTAIGGKEKAEAFFLEGMTQGHASPRRASASRISRHNLLCL